MAKLRPLAINLALMGLSLFAVSVVLELGARWVLFHGGDPDRFQRYASLRQLQEHPELAGAKPRYSPHRYLGYYPTPNFQAGKNKHSSQGFRDDEIPIPKPADEFRIVCVGGSTTYTPCVGHYEYSYPKCLERELKARGHGNIRVINAGADGYTSYETTINFALRVQDMQPDLLIIRDGVNDVFSRIVWPPSAYKGDNSGFRISLVSNIFMPGLLEYSTLARGIMIKLGWTQPHTAMMRALDLHHGETFHAFEFEEQMLRGTYPSGVFKEAAIEKMFEANTPTYFQRNIRNTVAMAQRIGCKTALVTISYSPHDKVRKDIRPIMSSPEFIAEVERCNQTIRDLGTEMGVPVFDVASAFPKEDKYFQDGFHVNFDGVQLEGRIFADFVEKSGLLPKTATQ